MTRMLYNPWSGAYMGLGLAIALFVIGLALLKGMSDRNETHNDNRLNLATPLILFSSAALGLCSLMMRGTEAAFDHIAAQHNYTVQLPTTNPVVLGALTLVAIASLGVLTLALRTRPRSAFGILSAVTMVAGVGTTTTQAELFFFFEDGWALAVSIGWIITALLAVATIVAGIGWLRKRSLRRSRRIDRGDQHFHAGISA